MRVLIYKFCWNKIEIVFGVCFICVLCLINDVFVGCCGLWFFCLIILIGICKYFLEDVVIKMEEKFL